MKIETNSVRIRYGELFDLLHHRNKPLFAEVLDTNTEVAEVACETSPLFFGSTTDKRIFGNEEGIQFAFAEVV